MSENQDFQQSERRKAGNSSKPFAKESESGSDSLVLRQSAETDAETDPNSAGLERQNSEKSDKHKADGEEAGLKVASFPLPSQRNIVEDAPNSTVTGPQVEQTATELRLPNFVLGLTITVAITALAGFLANEAFRYILPGFVNLPTQTNLDLRVYIPQLLTYLPVHVYWSMALWRMSEAISIASKLNKTVMRTVAAAISALTLLTMPQITQCIFYQISPSGYRIEYEWMGNLPEMLRNLIWYATQCGWPIFFFHLLRKNEAPARHGFFTFLACTANFLLMGYMASKPFPLYFSWSVAQFACLWLMSKRLTHRTEDSSKGKSKGRTRSTGPASFLGLSAGDDIILNYQPFAAITRWRKQQEGALSKDLKVIISIALPVLFCCYMLGLNLISNYEVESQRQKYVAEQTEFYRNEYAENLEQYRAELSRKLEPVKRIFGTGSKSKYAYFDINLNGNIASEIGIANADDNSPVTEPLLQQTLSSLQPLPPPPTSPLNPSATLPVRLLWNPTNPERSFELTFGNGVIQKAYLRQDKSNSLATTSYRDIEASKGFISYLTIGSLALAWLGILFVSSKPTHIGISRNGWRYLWRRRSNKRNGEYIRWTNLSRIFVESKRNSTSPLDQNLCFEQHNGTVHEINMGAMESVEDREALLKAIEKWGQNIQRAPEVQQALQPPADHSYTELWLQALSAPPQRERLKPLSAQTKMKNGFYTVMEQIGTGGQGQAYLAEDQDRNSVVLKECILPVFVDVNVRRKALEQFENEARLLRQLDHPQIVKLLDFFVEDHRTYLVLEHINGKSLRQIVKEGGALSEEKVRQLAEQMCNILAYLHGLNPPVVHRDFTPDNLILHKDGTLKLIDFNVARQVVESTTSGTVVGKHAYLPPEQFRGMPECASDIYAFGATLHFLLCGADPEPISTSHPKRIKADVSNAINDLVSRATALDLQKRFKNVEEIMADLGT